MQPPIVEEKKVQIRNVVSNLSQQANPLWANSDAMARIRRFAPDRFEEFWAAWDALDNRFREFLDDRVPWSETREVEAEITITGGKMLNHATGDWEPLRCRTIQYEESRDVMSAARAVFLLLFDLQKEFLKKGEPRE